MRVSLALVCFAASCKAATPTAADVCSKLVSAGVAANCHRITPAVINARASDEYEFDLPSVPGHGGAVLSFAKADDYASTVAAYEAAAMLAGPHRYGNATARIFVQLNDGASPAIGDKTKAVITEL